MTAGARARGRSVFGARVGTLREVGFVLGTGHFGGGSKDQHGCAGSGECDVHKGMQRWKVSTAELESGADAVECVRGRLGFLAVLWY